MHGKSKCSDNDGVQLIEVGPKWKMKHAWGLLKRLSVFTIPTPTPINVVLFVLTSQHNFETIYSVHYELLNL